MGKVTAIEWDDLQIRGLVASVTGSSVSVSKAFTIPLESAPTGNESVSETIARLLHDQKVGRGDAIVSVGRSGTELRIVEVPNAPEAELPPMVKFQALRQFAAMTEDWTLDYLPMSRGEEFEQVKVMAAAMSPQLLEQINTVCDKTHLNAKNILLRPFSLATLINQLLPSEHTRLCIDVAGQEADLLILRGAKVEMIRTVRLIRDEEGKVNPVQAVAEVKRTLVAFGNQSDADEISQIVVCGGENDLWFADELHQKTSIDATIFDPVQLVDPKGKAFSHLGDERRRFAGLIGAVMEPAGVADTRVDFLNPRKPPEPIAERRRNVLIAATCATVVLAIFGYFGLQIYLKGARVKSLQQQVNSMRNGHELVVQRVMDYEMVAEFADGAEYNWLDEMDDASSRIPEDGVIIDSVAFTLNSENSATMTISGRATESTLIEDLEDNLRDDRHQVTPRSNESIAGERDFPWKFGESVAISTPKETEESADGADDASDDSSDDNSARDDSDEDDADQDDADEDIVGGGDNEVDQTAAN